MSASPIRDHEAFESPILLENILQRVGIFTTEVSIDPVVGTHHGTGIGDGDGNVKGEQIGLLHRALRDDRIHKETSRLLVVHHVVLDVADDMLLLLALHQVADDRAGEERIFARVLEVAPIPGLAE